MNEGDMRQSPERSGDFSIETRGIDPVPDAERHGPAWRIFTVWFSANMIPPTFFIGTLAAADYIQLGFISGLMAVILGNVIGASFVGLTAMMGPKTGMPQLALGRLSFGRLNVVPAILNWAGMVAWTAVDTVFGAAALSILTGFPFWIGALAVIAITALIVMIGYEAILTFQKYMAFILSIVFVIVAFRIVSVGQFDRPDGFNGADRTGSFILMTTIVASFALSWCVFGSDYTRYLPRETSERRVFALASGGLLVACAWLEILGLAVAGLVSGSAVGTIYADVLGGGVLGTVAMVAIFFGIVSVNVLNTYTGSLSLLTVGFRMPRSASALVVTSFAFVLAVWLNSSNFADTFANYLLLISYWIAPFAAVVLTDWWLRGRVADVSKLLDIRELQIGWPAVVSFALGICASIPFMSTTLFTGPVAAGVLHYGDIAYYVGFTVAAGVYASFRAMGSLSGQQMSVRRANTNAEVDK
ncbi:purine-cytosine permease family protein [Rhodococcus sp. MSC1_016]|uniref:purine-cytosine permease family protein n=1 Tax=Rhodococcus sp. MSC1_016 TaxID=2909266 RepID=UPI00202E3C41|nr:cytosine permease [Rhodococcus sp. MSC1_016]